MRTMHTGMISIMFPAAVYIWVLINPFTVHTVNESRTLIFMSPNFVGVMKFIFVNTWLKIIKTIHFNYKYNLIHKAVSLSPTGTAPRSFLCAAKARKDTMTKHNMEYPGRAPQA